MGAERAQTQWHVEQSISDDMIVSWWARNELQYELQHDGKEQRVLRPVERQPPSPPLSNKERRKIFLGTWNDAAIKDSIDTIARALHSGTVVHMDWHMGFYAVGPHEKQGCIHCDAPVHVLGGVMLGTALSRCMICHAPLPGARRPLRTSGARRAVRPRVRPVRPRRAPSSTCSATPPARPSRTRSSACGTSASHKSQPDALG